MTVTVKLPTQLRGAAGGQAEADDVGQVLGRIRQRAEAVDQLGGESVTLAPAGELGDAAVQTEPHAKIAT